MHRLIAASVFCFAFTTTAFGQTQTARATQPAKAAQPESATKLETFQAKTGVVIVKGFSNVGRVPGIGGSAAILSMEFTDAQTGRKEQGIVIEVKESGRLEREDRSFIDYDEIDSLLKGIDYISKIDPTVTKLSSFEATYRTKGDFSITTFSDSSSGGISVAIQSGRIGGTSMYIKLAELPTFRSLIVEAKSKLDAAK